MLDSGLMDKVVLIIGANHGIGTATARALGSQGAKLFVIYLGEPMPDAVMNSIRMLAAAAIAFECDLADAEAPARSLAFSTYRHAHGILLLRAASPLGRYVNSPAPCFHLSGEMWNHEA